MKAKFKMIIFVKDSICNPRLCTLLSSHITHKDTKSILSPKHTAPVYVESK